MHGLHMQTFLAKASVEDQQLVEDMFKAVGQAQGTKGSVQPEEVRVEMQSI
jgi:hypothetical protein